MGILKREWEIISRIWCKSGTEISNFFVLNVSRMEQTSWSFKARYTSPLPCVERKGGWFSISLQKLRNPIYGSLFHRREIYVVVWSRGELTCHPNPVRIHHTSLCTDTRHDFYSSSFSRELFERIFALKSFQSPRKRIFFILCIRRIPARRFNLLIGKTEIVIKIVRKYRYFHFGALDREGVVVPQRGRNFVSRLKGRRIKIGLREAVDRSTRTEIDGATPSIRMQLSRIYLGRRSCLPPTLEPWRGPVLTRLCYTLPCPVSCSLPPRK